MSPYARRRFARFVAASSCPAMEEAARVLGIDQPTLVSQINRLEQDLGHSLLERAERGRALIGTVPTGVEYGVLFSLCHFGSIPAGRTRHNCDLPGSNPNHHGPVTTWIRCHWDEEDIWFYLEVDPDGWVTRQVELQGPELAPLAAASLDEWQQAHDAGRLDEYDNRFGITAERPVSEWEGHDPETLTSEEFEEVWGLARRQIASRPR